MAVTFSNRLRPKSSSGPGSAGAEPIDDAALVRAALAGGGTALAGAGRGAPRVRPNEREAEAPAEGAAAARHHAASSQSAAQEVEVLERERAGRLRRAL